MTKRGTLQTIDGLPVKNLTKKIKLVITKADCIKGKSKAPNACAAAVACTRQLPGCIEARVHVGRVYIKVRGRPEGILAPWQNPGRSAVYRDCDL